MNADETDRQADVVRALQDAAKELADAMGLADFNERRAEVLRRLSRTAADAAGEATPGGLELAPTVGELLETHAATLEARAEKRELPVPLPWAELERLYDGGLWPGAHFLVGSTGVGKTALQLQLALHAARAGVPVLYVGLEMGGIDAVARLLALLEEARPGMAPGAGAYATPRPGVWASQLMHGHVAPERVRELLEVARVRLAALPIRFESRAAFDWDYTQLGPRVHAMRKAHGCEGAAPVLVVLDYLQLVSSPSTPNGRREDVRERVKQASYAAHRVAAECHAAVLVVSSTSRTNDKLLQAWGEAWPSLTATVDGASVHLRNLVGLGKESGEVEYSAHTVAVLALTKREPGAKGPMRVRYGVAKGRYGDLWPETTMLFTGSRWDDDDKREEARAPAAARAEADEVEKEKTRADRAKDKERTRLEKAADRAKAKAAAAAAEAKAATDAMLALARVAED